MTTELIPLSAHPAEVQDATRARYESMKTIIAKKK